MDRVITLIGAAFSILTEQPMSQNVYRYAFIDTVPTEEIETTILLAIIAVESLHGESQARLDIGHAFDPGKRACVIDATTAVGRDFNRLFIGFLVREFGASSFKVERVGKEHPEPIAV
jgi:hypothetical protein